MGLSIETCIKSLSVAVMNRREAFAIEMAVGFAIFHSYNAASREARDMLCDAYASAGYQCLRPTDMDYKTVNRRINATASLYERMPVAKWAGRHAENDLIRAMRLGLEPFELLTVQDVLRFCEPPKPTKTVEVRRHERILSPESAHTGQQSISQMFRRAGDKDARRIETEHLVLMIPDGTPHVELLEMANKIIALAVDSSVSKAYPSETHTGEPHHEHRKKSTA